MQPNSTAAAPKTGDRRVWGDTRPTGGTPLPTSRPPSRTTSLPWSSAKDLLNALAYAEATLPPNTAWAHATMLLQQSDYPTADPRDYLALQERIFRDIRRWLRSKNLPWCCLWVREARPTNSAIHTHALLTVPPELRAELAERIYRVGKLRNTSNARAVVITPERDMLHRPDTRGMHTRAQLSGLARDLLKTLSPKAHLNGVPVMPALGIRHRAPCVIFGKRSGTAESISLAARKRAGWRELTALAELRAVLPTKEEARQQRDREKKRRRRMERALGHAPKPRPKPVPVWKPVPFTVNSSFDTSDLALDFLEEGDG